MNKKLLSHFALALFAVSACRVNPDIAAFKETLDGWKAKRPQPTAGTSVSKIVDEQHSDHVMRYQETATSVTKRLEDLVLHDNSASSVYPGALLWTQPLLAGEIVPLRDLKGRPPVNVSFIGAKGPDPFAHNGTHPSFSQAYAQQAVKITKSTPALSYKLYVGEDLNATMLEAGLSAKYWGAKLGLETDKKGETRSSYAVVVLDQVYYSLAAAAPPTGGYAPISLLAADAAASEYHALMQTKGEVGFVRRVTYGRRLVLAISAKATQEAVRSSLNFSLSNVDGSITGKVDESSLSVWSSMKLNGVVIGGYVPSEATANLLTGPREHFLRNLNTFLTKTLEQSPDAGGALISFEVAYADDDAIFASHETAEYSGRDAGRKLRKAGSVTASDVPVSTGNQHGRIIASDGEIDSDDFTFVTMAYELRVAPDKRSVEAKFSWDALEGDSKKRFPKDTHIRSERDWHPIWRLQPDDRRSIERIEGAAAASHGPHFFAGKSLFRPQPFPGFGGMKNIFVVFDADGGDDEKIQSMSALMDFTVYLAGEN
jgi:hypothetical protein